MEVNKIGGILSVLLGLIFVIFPMFSASVVSIIIGLSLLFFGIIIVFSGINLKNIIKSQGQFFTPKNVIDLMVNILRPERYKSMIDLACGFRVVIMTQANSQVNTRVLELLPKFKIKKMNCWCAV